MKKINLSEEVKKLRKHGKTYTEIKKALKTDIPKSTLSYWCKGIKLPKKSQDRIQKIVRNNREKARTITLIVNKTKRERYLNSIFHRNRYLETALRNEDTAKIALAMLYLCEGSKNPKRGSMMFGNSDPFIISLFLRLLR